jgi:hypothetical protein
MSRFAAPLVPCRLPAHDGRTDNEAEYNKRVSEIFRLANEHALEERQEEYNEKRRLLNKEFANMSKTSTSITNLQRIESLKVLGDLISDDLIKYDDLGEYIKHPSNQAQYSIRDDSNKKIKKIVKNIYNKYKKHPQARKLVHINDLYNIITETGEDHISRKKLKELLMRHIQNQPSKRRSNKRGSKRGGSKKSKKTRKGGMFRGYRPLREIRNLLYHQPIRTPPLSRRSSRSSRSSMFDSEDSDVGRLLHTLGLVRPRLDNPLPELHAYNENRFRRATRRCRPYSPYRGHHAHTVGGKNKKRKTRKH